MWQPSPVVWCILWLLWQVGHDDLEGAAIAQLVERLTST